MTTGTLHKYHKDLLLFEHLPSGNLSTPPPPPKHIILFIGGLYDTFLLPHYTTDLSSLFPLHSTQSWRLLHIQLSSNGRAWGIQSIDRDIEEIALGITYIRTQLFPPSPASTEADIVLMGHSTGCQDIMRYLTAPNPTSDRATKRPVVQGAILQAPVSDRDAALHNIAEGPEVKKAYEAAMKFIQNTPEPDHRDVILPMTMTKPLFGPVPVSVARFLSLVSPGSPENPSVEDFFSSDLTDARLRTTFGVIGKNKLLRRSTGESARETQSLLVLMSDSDEFAGAEVNQRQLLERWKNAMREESGAVIHGDSAVILNAMHDVGGDDWPSQEARLVVLRKKVLHYLKYVVGDVDKHADEIWHTDGDRVMKMKIGDGRSIEDQKGVLKL